MGAKCQIASRLEQGQLALSRVGNARDLPCIADGRSTLQNRRFHRTLPKAMRGPNAQTITRIFNAPIFRPGSRRVK